MRVRNAHAEISAAALAFISMIGGRGGITSKALYADIEEVFAD
jgi:hypothetical protein